MSFGWVDPNSVKMDNTDIVSDFYVAKSGKRLILKVPAENGLRLDSLLDAQSKHGVVFLNSDIEGLNAAETVRGTVKAENRSTGDAELEDGRRVSAEFPQSTFDEPGHYRFRGTGVVDAGVLNVFAATTIASDEPAHNPGP